MWRIEKKMNFFSTSLRWQKKTKIFFFLERIEGYFLKFFLLRIEEELFKIFFFFFSEEGLNQIAKNISSILANEKIIIFEKKYVFSSSF